MPRFTKDEREALLEAITHIQAGSVVEFLAGVEIYDDNADAERAQAMADALEAAAVKINTEDMKAAMRAARRAQSRK